MKETKSHNILCIYTSLHTHTHVRTHVCILHSPKKTSGAKYSEVTQAVTPWTNSVLRPKSATHSPSATLYKCLQYSSHTHMMKTQCTDFDFLASHYDSTLFPWMKCKPTFRSWCATTFWLQYSTADLIWKESVISILEAWNNCGNSLNKNKFKK